MGVKTPPLSSRMRGPIFPPLPPVPFRGPANLTTPLLNAPPSHYCAPFPPPTALPLPPHGRPLVGALPPILPIAAHHPIPSPVIPRLREESHRPTLNAPPSHYCAPFPPPNTPLPPHGRPPWAPSPPGLGAKVGLPHPTRSWSSEATAGFYNIQELGTALHYGISPVPLVFNDNAPWGVPREFTSDHLRRALHRQRPHNPDFVKHGRTLRNPPPWPASTISNSQPPSSKP